MLFKLPVVKTKYLKISRHFSGVRSCIYLLAYVRGACRVGTVMGELLHGGLAWAREAVTHTKVLAQTNYTHPAEHKNNDTYKYIQLLMPKKINM